MIITASLTQHSVLPRGCGRKREQMGRMLTLISSVTVLQVLHVKAITVKEQNVIRGA